MFEDWEEKYKELCESLEPLIDEIVSILEENPAHAQRLMLPVMGETLDARSLTEVDRIGLCEFFKNYYVKTEVFKDDATQDWKTLSSN